VGLIYAQEHLGLTTAEPIGATCRLEMQKKWTFVCGSSEPPQPPVPRLSNHHGLVTTPRDRSGSPIDDLRSPYIAGFLHRLPAAAPAHFQ
jgi:hypothetical protein